MSALGCALIAELDGRGVAGELGYPSTGVLLAERLRIGWRPSWAAAGGDRADVAAAIPAGRRSPGGPGVN